MTVWKNRITVNPNVLVGKPVIKGTRISVELIMDRLADGWPMEQILASFPRITREDTLAAIAFVTEVFREEDHIVIGGGLAPNPVCGRGACGRALSYLRRACGSSPSLDCFPSGRALNEGRYG